MTRRGGGEGGRRYVRCLIHTRRHAVLKEINEEGMLARLGRLELLDEVRHLLRTDRLRDDAHLRPLCDVLVVLLLERRRPASLRCNASSSSEAC